MDYAGIILSIMVRSQIDVSIIEHSGSVSDTDTP